MISEYQKKFLSITPSYKSTLDRYLKEWGDGPPLYTLEFEDYAHFLAKSFEDLEWSEKRDAFQYIEDCVVSNDDIARDSATTGFLEAIMNSIDNGRMTLDQVRDYIGEKSLAYCIAWDRFNGTNTMGSAS